MRRPLTRFLIRTPLWKRITKRESRKFLGAVASPWLGEYYHLLSYFLLYCSLAGIMHLKLLVYIVQDSSMRLPNLVLRYTTLAYTTLSTGGPLNRRALF